MKTIIGIQEIHIITRLKLQIFIINFVKSLVMFFFLVFSLHIFTIFHISFLLINLKIRNTQSNSVS